jgi:acetylornithine/succinyldiaminopimelate/putrescine aminotransferase
LIGSEYWRNAFRPLLPGILHYHYNSFEAVNAVNEEVACVVVETVQGEAGVISPKREWIKALHEKCTKTGTLLILDEVQTAFGRTGKLWAFEHFDVVPNILLLGKALGGGMPLGAFVADRKLMSALSENPVLGHITTFGGHPVCCAAGLAAMQTLIDERMIDEVQSKQALFTSLLVHKKIKSVRSFGLWLAVEFDSFETNKKIIDACIAAGVLTDWFLFAPNCLRISPPLIISKQQIEKSCGILRQCVDQW